MMQTVICGAGTARHLVKVSIQDIIFDTIGKLTFVLKSWGRGGETPPPKTPPLSATVSRLTGSLVQWIEQPISNR